MRQDQIPIQKIKSLYPSNSVDASAMALEMILCFGDSALSILFETQEEQIMLRSDWIFQKEMPKLIYEVISEHGNEWFSAF